MTVVFRGPDVCQLTGLSYRQLDYWIRLGVFTPHVNGRGSGTARLYSPADVDVCAALRVLNDAGVPITRLRTPELYAAIEAVDERPFLIVNGEHYHAVAFDELPDALVAAGVLVVLDLRHALGWRDAVGTLALDAT